jgi:DNA mismatch repair protein MSH2
MAEDEQDENKNLQIKEDKTFLAYFKTLPHKPDDLIRFFDRKGFYSLHGDDAVFIAHTHFNSPRALKYWGTEQGGFAYVTIRDGIEFESVIDTLLRKKQYRVEVYASKPGRATGWECVKRGSPGNLQDFEDVLFVNNEMRETTIIMSVKLGSEGGTRVVGVAYADATLRKLGVSQFPDTDQFTNLESFILQVGAKECLVLEEKSYDFKRLCDVLERCNVPKVARPRGDFDTKNMEQDLTSLLGSIQNNLPELEQKLAMGALEALIAYLDLIADDANRGKFKLQHFTLADYMRLDSSAFRALNIFSSTGGVSNTGYGGGMSLYGLLNHCGTSMGSRRLMQWVKQPLLSLEAISRRHDFVETFVQDVSLRETIRSDILKRIPDCDRLSKNITSKRAGLEHCVTLYTCVARLPQLKDALSQYDGPHVELLNSTFVAPIDKLITDFGQFCSLVENTIDLEQADALHEYNIRPSFSAKLQDLHNEKTATLESFEDIRLQVAARLDLDSNKVKLDNNSTMGYFFRVSKKDEPTLRGKSDMKILDMKKDGVRFRNTKMAGESDKYINLQKEYEATQATLVEKIMEIVLSYISRLEDLSNLLADLDVYVNLAHVSVSGNQQYVRPVMRAQGTGTLALVNSRHPCVEAQDSINFIANDAIMSPDSRFHIITGPNMGGKSTYIRQIGVIVLMAQIGSFVPCDSATISIVDCILARVGAGDSQLRGVSTFMAEMLETAAILRSATKDSLIIIDELGRGTSTYDGFGLAWAISKHICTKLQAFCLFATHFHELTALANQIEGVKNLHVTAKTSENALSLLYKVEQGACDQSFGIHVARLAHFPESVIEAAKLKAAELEDFEGDGLSRDAGEVIAADDAAVKRFMDRFVNLPLGTLGAADAFQQTKRLAIDILGESAKRVKV